MKALRNLFSSTQKSDAEWAREEVKALDRNVHGLRIQEDKMRCDIALLSEITSKMESIIATQPELDPDYVNELRHAIAGARQQEEGVNRMSVHICEAARIVQRFSDQVTKQPFPNKFAGGWWKTVALIFSQKTRQRIYEELMDEIEMDFAEALERNPSEKQIKRIKILLHARCALWFLQTGGIAVKASIAKYIPDFVKLGIECVKIYFKGFTGQ